MSNFNKYIRLIKEQACETATRNGQWVYKVGSYWVRFWQDNGITLNGLDYTHEDDRLFWTSTTPQEFYQDYVNDRELSYVEYSVRYYGQPKLNRPIVLRGVKSIGTVSFQNRAKCQIFIQGDDVWIKHRDYHSREVSAASLPLESESPKKKKRLIYKDEWGSIVLRNEAWICLKNLVHHLRMNQEQSDLELLLAKSQGAYFGLDWTHFSIGETARFFEKVIRLTKEQLKQELVLSEC